MSRSRRAALVAAALAVSASASASDTDTFLFDTLGRLVRVTTSGGPQSGRVVGISYDPAGNRRSYNVTGAVAAALTGSALSGSATTIDGSGADALEGGAESGEADEGLDSPQEEGSPDAATDSNSGDPALGEEWPTDWNAIVDDDAAPGAGDTAGSTDGDAPTPDPGLDPVDYQPPADGPSEIGR